MNTLAPRLERIKQQYSALTPKIQNKEEFPVTAWNNGGKGYGFSLYKPDRDLYFSREMNPILLYLPNIESPIKVNIDKDSFWEGCCYELIHVGIKEWLSDNGHAPWPKGSPPKFMLERISPGKFKLKSKPV